MKSISILEIISIVSKLLPFTWRSKMTDVPAITIGHLKEIWKQHNVSDDDTIAFHFTNTEEHDESKEIEFDRLYKREFGILMDFVSIEGGEKDE